MGTTIECFVNDQYAQTCLASKYDKGKLSFNVEGDGAKLLQVTVKIVKLKL
jgi:hypothetical protein